MKRSHTPLYTYTARDYRKRNILDLHFKGLAPSEIEKTLMLHQDEARFTISDYWLYDKLTH